MSEISDLTDRVTALLGRRDLSQREYQDWMAGSATGGPNGDGLYPLTDSTGFVRMVPCPAKVAELEGGGGFDLAGFLAVPPATQAQVSAGPPQMVGVTADGALGRFPADMFGSRKTAGLDALHSDEWAESLACFTSTGSERRMAIENVLRAVGNVIDPSHPPYNVRYDAQKAKPAQCTANSNVITTTDNSFVQGDVGKLLVIGNATSQGCLRGYIGQVVDAKTIRLYTDTSFSTPALATNNRSTEELIWGTDCTAGLQAALDAAEPVSQYARGKVVVLGGLTMVSSLRFGSISIVGLSQTGCGFYCLPSSGAQFAPFADKNTGQYSYYRPDAYTIRNLTIYGQRYTQFYNSFRRAMEIRGGDFGRFLRGAPYAVIDGLDVYEAQWDGVATSGAFAGLFNNVRTYSNAQCGLRMGFWDLNGINWHAEANGCAGIFSVMPGCNVSTVRASYNGQNGGQTTLGGQYWVHELGSQMTEAGFGNTWTNVRMQESWAHSLCISGSDPLNIATGRGTKNAIYLSTFDDTGNIAAGKGWTGGLSRLPGVRSMIYIKGNTAVDNTVTLVSGAGQVQPTNYATNGYWDEGNPSGNQVELRTPGISNDPSSWYSGSGQLAATARGPWGTSSTSSIGARQNIVEVNRVRAP